MLPSGCPSKRGELCTEEVPRAELCLCAVSGSWGCCEKKTIEAAQTCCPIVLKVSSQKRVSQGSNQGVGRAAFFLEVPRETPFLTCSSS